MGGGGQAWQKEMESAICQAWNELEVGLTDFLMSREEVKTSGTNAHNTDLVLLHMATINIFILHQHAISAVTLHQHPESPGKES